MIPPALWLFFRHQFAPDFTFQRRQLVLFIPALFEILLSSLNYFLKGSFLRPVGFTVWLVLVDWLPLSLTVLVLVAYSKNLVASLRETKESQRAHLWKMVMVLVVFWLMTIIWAAESVFGFDLHILFQTSTAVILFSLAYAAYFDPAFLSAHNPPSKKTK
ncbi:hypothetical protein HK413_01190 [Mucilaginibacter sp. S1162]|uniref:DUF2919 domain-containing protein n=2 Tax=Mucilaginibacter humi TaxID=2732510 RepID=A0ABX1W3H1_9SPHI|nr:hypothetical protein [Mucilaginibacter humi]